MIVLITYWDEDAKRVLVSHGLDDMLRTVILPQVPPSSIGWFNKDMGEWVLRTSLDAT